MLHVRIFPLVLLLPVAVLAQELAPGTRYDPAIPTLESVVGHDHGDELTTPEEAGVYLRALAGAAPDRTHLVEYATSWEGRPLYLMAIGSAARIGELDETKEGLRRLADPRNLSADEIDALIDDMPVVTWLIHGVHGNEISSTDASLAEAYHLLAAEGDGLVDGILRESIVLIDPMQNPDGRARFIYQHLLGRAATPDPEPASAEHDEPWPGGRSNHYLFDINRDWFAQSQPETQGRIGVYLDWMPHVVVDLHEMGGNSTYFFAPPTRPLNPRLSASQNEWLDAFGRGNAARFDQRGFAYFIRESYDLFYPGYGDSWPSLQGAIGMTYEQASARGLVFRRNDETYLSYKDGVVQHFTAAIATADTAARNRVGILRDFAQHRRGVGDGGVVEYLLPPANDPSRTERLGRQLVAQGIEVRVADAPATVGERTVPAGTLVVSLAQPAGRLAATLLDAETRMDAAFLEEQDRRRRRRENDQIYDITGWSLPLVFDVEAIASESATAVDASPLAPGSDGGVGTLPAAQVAYLMPWGLDTAAAVVEALASGIRVRFADDGFTMEGREYPAGTAILRMSENDANLASTLGEIAGRHGAEVVPTDTGWVDDGVALGSNRVRAMKAPRILLAWDTPTSSQSAGWARFVLERRYGQAVTVVRTGSLGRVDLSRYDVLVLPSGNYGRALTGATLQRVKDWVRGGATIVTIGEASRWAARESTELLATTTELRDGSAEVEDDDEDDENSGSPDPDGDEPFDLETAIAPDRELPESIPGALLRVTLDPKHWLSAGSDGEIQVVVEGRRVFTPITLDDGVNVGIYAPKDRLVASGLAWENSQDLIAQKAFLIHQPMGQGHVIAFAEDPNFRAFAETTQLLFMNAVLLGPAH
ncbi:MAG: M14 family metallopeptidase [Vicinamibacterales bacterium]|jgi:hypothetical protein|nr:peptidase M14 [Acidobacteriota bacterium]MDP6372107.1 M14 family metallopeptidase [Vicinamibacterales bacterium]MDP6609255.1 M14 family metallopeptidase [Vicinamibacterales bacterium]HAK57327.1 peptidase M14 [Acidobacteriota bacterium]|tara:strand:+ start:279 stop:2909 length:2631 start_codon:yes stop_codon:yes gene_type:complete